uniref:Uncharacterized protein n=1 Tax=Aegilops tauschii subsp. strangulata TaxID=200361 RepID=A0A453E8R1_AEGTS
AAAPSSAGLVTVYGMSLPQGFIRRKGILAPRIDRHAQNCYKTFKIGRNKVICKPNDAMLDETKDVPKVDEPQAGGTMVDEPQTGGTQSEAPLLEAPQPESSLPVVQTQSPGNPLAGLLNAIAVIASGVLAGLYGTSRQEKEALQSVVSSVNHLQ